MEPTYYTVNTINGDYAYIRDTVLRRVADLIANPAETATADMGGLTVTAYRFSDGVVAVWRDGTHVMALHGDRGTALADLLAVAAQITVAHG